MKYQIRQGVFETNSSSTHSMQIVDSSINDPKKVIKAIIEEAYGEPYSENQFDETEYYFNNVLTLHTLHFEDSDEDKVVIYMIKNTIAKIEYLFMNLLDFTYQFDTLEGTDRFAYSTRDEIRVMIEKSKQYKWFTTAVLDFIKEHNPEIKIDEIKIGYCGDFGCLYYDDDTIFNTDMIKDEKALRDKIFEVLNENYVILDKDVAYRPYQAPIIVTY